MKGERLYVFSVESDLPKSLDCKVDNDFSFRVFLIYLGMQYILLLKYLWA